MEIFRSDFYMIDLTDKKLLEGTFAEDFGSPYYPVLASIYLQEGDLRRARKVCEIGLDHDSTNVDGKFILAKVALSEEKFTMAEKLLKQVVKENSSHFIALRMLIKLEFQLKRSTKTIRNYLNHFIVFDPKDKEFKDWMTEIQNLETEMPNSEHMTATPSNTTSSDKNNESISKSELVKEKPYELVDSMVTFSMLHVLKSQKHYQQALAVLNELESKSDDQERISKERNEIKTLLAQIQSL